MDWVFGVDAIIGLCTCPMNEGRDTRVYLYLPMGICGNADGSPAMADGMQQRRLCAPRLARLLCLCRVGNAMRWARIRRGISIMPTASQPVLLLLVCMHAYALAAVASCSAGPSCSCRSIDGLNLNLTCLPLGLVGH